MLDEQHEKRVRLLFMEEAAEHFHSLQQALGLAQKDPERSKHHLQGALRAAHSLKGAAALAGFSRLQKMLHNFESCVASIAAGKLKFDSKAAELLSRALDVAENETRSERTTAAADADIRRLFEDLGSHFGISEMRDVEAEIAPVSSNSSELAERVASVRVATHKIDRQMANTEELLRLKIGAETRLQGLESIASSLEQWQAALNEMHGTFRRLNAAKKVSGIPELQRVQMSVNEQVTLAGSILANFAALYTQTREQTHSLATLADALSSDVRAVRMMPLETVLAPFSRLVREVARDTKKQAELRIIGAATEVDRDVLDALHEPVLHILRNAVDHGIESADERRNANKPDTANITITATSRASSLELEISDDGRGVSVKNIAHVAIERGLVTREELATWDEQRVQALIFADGFSTASTVTGLSGRGVGLAAARRAIDKLGGRLELASVEGRGSTFKLIVPLTLATSRLLLVEAGGELLAIPALAVERVVRVQSSAVTRVDHGFAFELSGKPIPVFQLAEAIALSAPAKQSERLLTVVLTSLERRAAFVVDRILDEQELVTRGLGDHLAHVPCVTGVAVLPNGEVAPILSAPDLLQRLRGGTQETFHKVEREVSGRRKRILVVDDSVTTRTLEKSILEAAGYEVEVATNGVEALERLDKAEFDLVLSDVQMPRMDGCSLTRAIRQQAKTKQLPVVLVSSLDTQEQRRDGLEAGAFAYLSKTEFEQGVLLSTLERFLR